MESSLRMNVIAEANRGSRQSMMIRMIINAGWILAGVIYAGMGFKLQDRYEMIKYVANGGAYHDPTTEIVIGILIIAFAAWCLYRNYTKNKVRLYVTVHGISGEDSSGRQFSLPFSAVHDVQIISNTLMLNTDIGVLTFKKVKNMARTANTILDKKRPLPATPANGWRNQAL